MKFGSLFSGIGGFDLGFKRAGMECAWQVEIDQKCQGVLERHIPGIRRYSDVRSVGRDLEPVDLICGGFPCQDLSVAGKRAGLAGERSGLWYEFHRVIEELAPGWVVIENVPGLLSSHGGKDFAVILRGLVELGYGVCWRVLDAQYFGVAQRRRRVFIVGHLGDGRAAEVLFERESGLGDTAPSREAGEGVARDVETISVAWHNKQQSGEVRIQGDTVNAVTQQWGTGGNNVPFVGVRRLTPVECERLQGFPDGWTAGQADSTRYRQLGNAVAVPCAEWIARRIIGVEDEHDE